MRISTVSGTHEELYHGLTSGRISLALNDQRRMFSEDYRNVVLADAACLVELSGRQALAGAERVELAELADLPCILIADKEYQAGEADYYRNILGVSGDFLFAGSLEEARLMVAGNRGFLLLEAVGTLPAAPGGIQRLPLYRDGHRLTRKYCLFWQKARTGYYVEEFAERFQCRLTGIHS